MSEFNKLVKRVKSESKYCDYELFIPSIDRVSKFLRVSTEWIEEQIKSGNVHCIYDDRGVSYLEPKEFGYLYLFRLLNGYENCRENAWLIVNALREDFFGKRWNEIHDISISIDNGLRVLSAKILVQNQGFRSIQIADAFRYL